MTSNFFFLISSKRYVDKSTMLPKPREWAAFLIEDNILILGKTMSFWLVELQYAETYTAAGISNGLRISNTKLLSALCPDADSWSGAGAPKKDGVSKFEAEGESRCWFLSKMSL